MPASSLLELLAQVASGVTIHEPFHSSPGDLREFQDTVSRLRELKELGLVRNIFTQVRAGSDGEYCYLAMVQGGLTAEGERVLAEYQSRRSAAGQT